MKHILLNRWVIGILAVTGVLLALQYLVPTGEHEEIWERLVASGFFG